ncbi:hypothetical protein EVS84_26485 [Pseudomonas koreensis]|uniref:Uncharacterized protein n=1 Tax=Pseudomonas koreensis TaxID=198620 RepID=A0A4Q4KUW9_9PSED|nr:hypothetical protein EVS84_26485 [Pseudomonas koreensis]
MGASLLAKADLQPTPMSTVKSPSRAGSLPQGDGVGSVNIPAIAALFDQAFDFGAAEDIVEGLVDA